MVGELALPRRLKPIPQQDDTDWTAGRASAAVVHAVNQGDRVHLFLNLEDRLFYRELTEPVAEWNSASEGAATDDLAGWTFTSDRKLPTQFDTYSPAVEQVMGMLIGGDPALVVINELTSKSALDHIYRYNAGRWSDAHPARKHSASNDCATSPDAVVLATEHELSMHLVPELLSSSVSALWI